MSPQDADQLQNYLKLSKVIERIQYRAVEQSARLILELGAQRSGNQLNLWTDIQRRLRDSVREADPDMRTLGSEKFRSHLNNKADALRVFLGLSASRSEGRYFWVIVSAHTLADGAIDALRDGPLEPKKTLDLLRPMVLRRSEMLLADLSSAYPARERALGIVQETLEDCEKALRRTIPTLDTNGAVNARALERAAGICNDPATFGRIGALILAARMPDWTEEELHEDAIRPWAYTMVQELLADQKARSDCYIPTPTGDIRIAATSKRLPGKTGDGLTAPVIARGRLHGGAATATGAPLPNDTPSAKTNSNHGEEGSPSRTLAVPFAADVGRMFRMGQMFLSLYREDGEDAPSIKNDPSRIAINVIIARSLGEKITGQPPTSRLLFTNESENYDSFLARLREEISGAKANDGETYNVRHQLTIVVVSSHPELGAIDEGERQSVDEFFDSWAFYTAQLKAEGEAVYQLESRGSYAFVRREEIPQGSTEPVDPDGLIIPATFADDGMPAGHLGVWNVIWTESELCSAREALRPKHLRTWIEKQVDMAAKAAYELSELATTLAARRYAKANQLANPLVSRFAGFRGTPVRDKIRLSFHLEDFATALDYARAREKYANWDLETHSDVLFGLLSLGHFAEAQKELNQCTRCNETRELLFEGLGSDPTIPPMLVLAQALAAGASAPAELAWRLRAQIEEGLQRIAPNESSMGHVLRAIEKTQLCLIGRSPDIAGALRDTELIVQGFDAGPETSPSLSAEQERLRRICKVLTGMLRNRPPDAEVTDELNPLDPSESSTVA